MSTSEPEPPQRGVEYPPLESLPPAVEYPTNDDAGYPGLPPPVYPVPYQQGYPPPGWRSGPSSSESSRSSSAW